MSFILESIKQAERDRKLGQVPTISVEYVTPNNEVLEADWMKWAGVSIGFIVAAVAIWATIRMLNVSEFFPISEYTETKVINDNPQQLIPETSKRDENNLVIVNKETVNNNNIQSSSDETNVNQIEFEYVPAKSLHNSQLKSVRVINYQEQESPLQIMDKRTEMPEQEEIQTDQIVQAQSIQPTDVINLNISNNVEPISIPDQNENGTPREKLVSIYSDLMVTTENELVDEASSPIIQNEPNKVPSDEEPITLASLDAAQPHVTTPQLAIAVNSGVSDFRELPYDVQEKIPDLNISVHMFNEDPTQRRIRINGQMYTEGKALQPGLSLVEITRLGAIFDYQGHAFRLNVR